MKWRVDVKTKKMIIIFPNIIYLKLMPLLLNFDKLISCKQMKSKKIEKVFSWGRQKIPFETVNGTEPIKEFY